VLGLTISGTVTLMESATLFVNRCILLSSISVSSKVYVESETITGVLSIPEPV